MGWLIGETRGPEWKQGWTRQTIASAAAQPPPTPLLAIFSIVVLFLAFSSYMDYKSEVNQTAQNFHLYLALFVILSIIVVVSLSFKTSFVFRLQPDESARRSGSASPWGVALLVVLLLLMVSYHSSFQSKWFRTSSLHQSLMIYLACNPGRGGWFFGLLRAQHCYEKQRESGRHVAGLDICASDSAKNVSTQDGSC
ncbi:hypothetical protein RJ641_028870 [Dillenia turbinata]|uniref:Uncharacterized protein n=1 Tax=Dillenia turbinata TaxID=194707 RepID=A0AAN8VSK1_9MAGN